MILSLLQLLIVNSRCSSDVIRRNFSSQLFHDISKDHKHSLEINNLFSLDNWMIDELVIDSILNYHNNIKIKLLTNLIQMFIPVEYFTFCRYIYNVLISSCSITTLCTWMIAQPHWRYFIKTFPKYMFNNQASTLWW